MALHKFLSFLLFPSSGYYYTRTCIYISTPYKTKEQSREEYRFSSLSWFRYFSGILALICFALRCFGCASSDEMDVELVIHNSREVMVVGLDCVFIEWKTVMKISLSPYLGFNMPRVFLLAPFCFTYALTRGPFVLVIQESTMVGLDCLLPKAYHLKYQDM